MDKHNKLKIVVILLTFAFVLSSCASINNNVYYYDEITIRNNGYQNVRNVKIKVEKTGLVFLCSFIPAKGECSNKFKKRPYLGNPVTLHWQFNGGVKSSTTVQLTLPNNAQAKKALKGMLDIDNQGRVNPYMYQE